MITDDDYAIGYAEALDEFHTQPECKPMGSDDYCAGYRCGWDDAAETNRQGRNIP